MGAVNWMTGSLPRLAGYCCAVAFAMAPACGSAQQEAWKPTQAVALISSTGVGGAQDRLARTIQAVLETEKLIPTPALVVNKPGGNGGISVAYLNQHAGDGHYLLGSSALMLTNHIMGRGKLNYTEITPIAQLFHEYSAVIVRADSPLKSGVDLIALIKAQPESVSIGVTTIGTSHHMSIVKAVKAAGIDPKRLKMVTFKSGSAALTATLGGHITASISSVSNSVAHMKSGKARVIAVSAPQRLRDSFAIVPTWKELGYESVSSNFRTVFGPREMPAPAIAYWENALSRVVVSPMWVKGVENNFWVSAFLDSRATQQYLQSEYKSMSRVLDELGLARH